jgi:hypothetical protein
MNIPIKQEDNYTTINTISGFSGNGSLFNKPTIPKIDYNPTTFFEVGRYNNNIQPTQLGTLFTDNSNSNYNTNNPINGNDWLNNKMLSSNGGNRGNHFKPNMWVPYNLKDSQINYTSENSQTFPYNTNSQFIDGSTRRVWDSFMFNNINSSTSSLEQVINQDISPRDRPQDEPQYDDMNEDNNYMEKEQQIAIQQLVDEMD